MKPWLAIAMIGWTGTVAAQPAGSGFCDPAQLQENGHCCWPGQRWSDDRKACEGAPSCPTGYRPESDGCVHICPTGQVIEDETAGNCCWPGQVWSPKRGGCVGIPACTGGLLPQGETCVAPVAPPPPAPPPLHAVPVTFHGVFESNYTVTAVTAGGREQSCTSPCTMRLPPGATHLRIRGSWSYEADVDVPNQAAVVRIHRRSLGWHFTGAGAAATSLAFLALGLYQAAAVPYSTPGVPLVTGGVFALCALGAFLIGDRTAAVLVYHQPDGTERRSRRFLAAAPIEGGAVLSAAGTW